MNATKIQAHEQHQEENGANEQCYENTGENNVFDQECCTENCQQAFHSDFEYIFKNSYEHSFFLTNYQMLFSTNKRHESRNQSNNK